MGMMDSDQFKKDLPRETAKKETGTASYSTKTVKVPSLSKIIRGATGTASTAWGKKPIRIGLLVLICLIFGFGGGLLGAVIHGDNSDISNASTTVKQQYISNESQLIAQIAKTVGQSVVSIDVQSQSSSTDIFGFSMPTSQESAGTGFFISTDGIIVTNRHVVPTGTDSVNVTLADGTLYKNVQVIGRTSTSSSLDIAFLKIPDLKGKKLIPATLGDSSKMQVGDRVIAIGNALGQFQNTVTSGIISGYGRDVTAADQSSLSDENLTDMFQTDASINEGNSGGPLVNINGEVIGINTAIASNAQNIGFATPINDVKGLISSVLKGGQLLQPYLGVSYISLTPDIAYEYNLSVQNGAYIISGSSGQSAVIAGSPADKAGLKEKDIITKVNNIDINETTSLAGALSQLKVGQTATLTVVRGSQTLTLQATLVNTPQ